MYQTQKLVRHICLLVLLLSLAALAAPKVALIKINSGTASLDGKDFKHAQMAAEGQSLKVAAGAEVRIQLLGSSSELTLTGPTVVKIEKSSLAAKAQKVTRGGLEVAADIGSRNSVGALVTRGSRIEALDKARRKALRPVLPPAKKNGALFVEYDSHSDIKLPQGAEVRLTIEPENEDLNQYLEVNFKDKLSSLEMAPDSVAAGERYEFVLTYTFGDDAVCRYTQTFRVLTQDQKDFLQEAQVEMLERYNQEKSILPLLRLASLYQDLDQNREVLKYLEVARRSPYLQENDAKLKEHLDKLIEQFQTSVDMTIPVID